MPLSGADRFPALFDYLDAHTNQLGISSYGISVTTLEEVFLRVGHAADGNVGTAAAAIPTTADTAAPLVNKEGAGLSPINTGRIPGLPFFWISLTSFLDYGLALCSAAVYSAEYLGLRPRATVCTVHNNHGMLLLC
jgi:hypothetical protein